MSSFDSELRVLIEEWLKRGASPQSMADEMGSEIGRLWAMARERKQEADESR